MISFIIPTKNEAKILENTLRSLALYTGDKEIIISDGRSTDGTLDIARKFTDHVVVYQGATRQTIADGRNLGAASAHGEYLVFLDADVHIPSPDAFFSVAEARFRADPQLMGLTVNIRVFKEMETLADRIIFPCFNFVNFMYNNVLGTGAAGGDFQMVRMAAFKKVGGFNAKLVAAEDFDFFRKVARIGKTRLLRQLTVFHTGRRAHSVGWPKLLATWILNDISNLLFRRAVSKEWTEIR